MRDATLTGQTVNLPIQPEGWRDFRYAVLIDGSLGVMRVEARFHEAYRQWRLKPDVGLDWNGRFQLSAFDGEVESSAVEVPMTFAPVFDRLRDGRWLVASCRARPGDANASLFDPDDAREVQFPLGDGIEHLRCMRDGSIWVGYFDEGIGGGGPLSRHGIVQISAAGDLIWGLNASVSAPWMLDCYALTLDGDRMWSCYHPDFPIVRIGGQQAQVWTNDEVAGATAMAIDRDHVLLAGTYDDPTLLSLVRLGTTGSTLVGQIPFEALAAARDGLVRGQASKLHVVHAGQWTTIEVDEVRRALA
ncbi:MAG: hypothetical protein HY859_08840 [Caulobacterales bacterium]|nr:hypothetical protein [Caulobacterales bacterium]